MRMMLGFLWRKKLMIIMLAVFAGGGFWWWSSTRAQEEPITTVKPEYRNITQMLTVSGSIDAEEKAVLKFPAMSQLTWLGVKEGDVVKKWQGIASVDSRTLQKQMQIAQNTHGKVYRNFEQTLDDLDYYDNSGLTEAERRIKESAELDIRNTILNVELADLAVKLSYMYSPINGLVVKIDQPNVGATIGITDTFVVVNPETVYFSAVIDEEDVGLIQSGQQAMVVLDAYTNQEMEALVYDIAFMPSASQTGGTGYRVKLSLPVDNTMKQYKLGMNGDASIVLNEQTGVLSVPLDSLISREGKDYVEVLVNGTLEQREVVIGISDDDFVAITKGLSREDDVVVPL
jgi:membrane fusion protein, macrolide-specific efflux system